MEQWDDAIAEEKNAQKRPAKLLTILPPLTRRQSHATRRTRVFSATVAVILSIVLVSGAWFLLNRESSSTNRTFSPTDTIASGAPVSPPTVSTTIRAQANGVEAVMQITPGPYFLSELLEANLSLTNHTETTFNLQGVPETIPCDPALNVDITGGTKPYYDIPVLNSGFMSCPLGMTHFKPGQTIHVHDDIPLNVSGRVVLTLIARFEYTGKYDLGNKNPPPVFDPLAHHWPSLAISVATKIPSNRVISLHLYGSQVTIDAPLPARATLRYLFTCWQFVTPGIIAGSTESGNFIWTPLGKTTLDTSQCSGSISKWTFAVGAPGYAIVNGHFPF